jgi:hypothetical protein
MGAESAADPASAAVQAASSVMGAIGSFRQGIWQKQADYAAAEQARQVGAAQQQRVMDSARQAIGNQIAGQFANGMQGGTGTAIDDVHQSIINGALDALTVQQQATAKADALETQGNIAKVKGIQGAMSALLGGTAQQVQDNSDWASAGRGQITPASAPGSGGGYNSVGFSNGMPTNVNLTPSYGLYS